MQHDATAGSPAAVNISAAYHQPPIVHMFAGNTCVQAKGAEACAMIGVDHVKSVDAGPLTWCNSAVALAATP